MLSQTKLIKECLYNMAAIQESILGMLHTVQTSTTFGAHMSQQRELGQEATRKNIKATEEEITNIQTRRTQAEAERQAAQQDITESYEYADSDPSRAAEMQFGVKDEYGQTVIPGAFDRESAARKAIEKEDVALKEAETRLKKQYKKLRRYGGR